MAKSLAGKIGIEVCNILGISSDNIEEVDIILKARDVVKVKITRFLEHEEIANIKKVIEYYDLSSHLLKGE